MEVKIYVLIDPVTYKIRYIGRTKCSLNTRLNGHLSKSKFKNNKYLLSRNKWKMKWKISWNKVNIGFSTS